MNQIRIMSDGNPTTMLAREMWVTVLHLDGDDYEEAETNILGYLRSLPTVYGWMNPFFNGELFPDMPLPEPEPFTRNSLVGFSRVAASKEPEPQPGRPALQRLEDLTFGEEG